MKAILGILVLAAVVVVARDAMFGSAEARESATAPDIEYLSDRFHDAGIVRAGEEVRHAFFFLNATDETLSIDRVGASCTCTTTDLDRKEIEPGGTARLEVLVQTAGRTGITFADIELFSGGEVVASFQLRVGVDATRRILVSPSRLTIAAHAAEGDPSRAIEIVVESFAADDEPQFDFEFEGEAESFDVAELQLVEQHEGWRRWTAQIASRTQQPSARTRRIVLHSRARFDGAVVSDRSVIEVPGALEFPKAIFLGGALPQGVPTTRVVRIPSLGVDVAEWSVSGASQGILGGVEDVSGANAMNRATEYLLKVTMTPTSIGLVEGVLTVDCQSSKYDVRVVGRCLP